MTGAPKYAIVADRITAAQREQIQGIVKANANGWWHAFADLWIVGGRTASEWRDLVGVAVPTVPSGVMVLKIDEVNTPRWSYKAAMSDANKEWLHKNV
ncbi:MAG: hypothetical protein WCB67_13870 [Solirubrobacteraceae bacterium]